MTHPDQPSRTRRDPADRAREALDRAERRVTRLRGAVDSHRTALAAALNDLTAAEQVRDYHALHPALTTNSDTTPAVLVVHDDTDPTIPTQQ